MTFYDHEFTAWKITEEAACVRADDSEWQLPEVR